MKFYTQDFLEELKTYTAEIAEQLLTHSPDGNFVCPDCGNGSKDSGTGIKFTGQVAHCFVCGESFNIFSAIKHQYNLNFGDAVKRCAEAVGLNPRFTNVKATKNKPSLQANMTHSNKHSECNDSSSNSEVPFHFDSRTKDYSNERKHNIIIHRPLTPAEKLEKKRLDLITPPEDEPEIPFGTPTKAEIKEKSYYHVDLTPYYEACNKALYDYPRAVNYLKRRNLLDKELLDAFKVGFDPTINCIVVPHNQYYCTRRSLSDKKKWRFFHNLQDVRTAPFNLECLKTSEVVFVVEGAMDALALIKCGAQAVAMAGAGQKNNRKRLYKAMNELKQKPTLVILFDDDVNSNGKNTGQDNAAKMMNELKTLNFCAINKILPDKNDANSLLVKDSEALKKFVLESITDAEINQAEKETLIMNDNNDNNNSTYEAELPDPSAEALEEIEALKIQCEDFKREIPGPRAFTERMIDKLLKSAFTDYDCADVFRSLFGRKYIFNKDTQCWFEYTGEKWEETDDSALAKDWITLAKAAELEAKARYKQMEYDNRYGRGTYTKSDFKAAYAVIKEIQKKLNHRSTQNTTNMLKALKDVVQSDNLFNSNKLVFNLKNGVVDLSDGELTIRPHESYDYSTMVAGAELFDSLLHIDDDDYENDEEEYECKEWEEFLRSAMPNAKTRKLLQKYIGYCLTGLTNLKVFFYLHGVADTGKSLFLNTIKKVLGDYAKTLPIEYLLDNKKELNGEEPAPLLAAMRHCRLALASETKENQKLAVAKIKRFTGSDSIIARALYCKKALEFVAQFKLLIAGNFMPKVDNIYDSGLRTRLRIIEFQPVPKGKKNTKLEEIFSRPENMKIIFKWILMGAIEVVHEINAGINPFDIENLPDDMKKSLERFYAGSDNIPVFMEDSEYEFYENKQVRVKDLFVEYLGWCKLNNERSLRRSDFIENILSHYKENGVALVDKSAEHKASLFTGLGHAA